VSGHHLNLVSFLHHTLPDIRLQYSTETFLQQPQLSHHQQDHDEVHRLPHHRLHGSPHGRHSGHRRSQRRHLQGQHAWLRQRGREEVFKEEHQQLGRKYSMSESLLLRLLMSLEDRVPEAEERAVLDLR
jgi:hypothetical protein